MVDGALLLLTRAAALLVGWYGSGYLIASGGISFDVGDWLIGMSHMVCALFTWIAAAQVFGGRGRRRRPDDPQPDEPEPSLPSIDRGPDWDDRQDPEDRHDPDDGHDPEDRGVTHPRPAVPA